MPTPSRGPVPGAITRRALGASGTVSRLFNVNELLALAVIAPPQRTFQPRTPLSTALRYDDIEWCSGVLLVCWCCEAPEQHQTSRLGISAHNTAPWREWCPCAEHFLFIFFLSCVSFSSAATVLCGARRVSTGTAQRSLSRFVRPDWYAAVAPSCFFLPSSSS